MPACTFFGHRDCPDSVLAQLEAEVERLIAEHDVDTFYVGNQGNFDHLAAGVLRRMKEKYPHIHYYIVLPYFPQHSAPENSLLPDGIETVHPRYAIVWRNRWMISRSDFVITFITHSFGGAAAAAKLAANKGKTVINITDE